ncbi:L,D-transpeptidase family protein [Alterisphingorhabdus coralli]|uniref:L,D-transpeptidase family protein n=1 Tax=Alterisphingorhabdus coralli TaxID=3071408 RepID=A0AA97HZG7_9SPHN|nr:L,D-transpeptidase family protein [Parasphingorhabdus sp. SCSIO 66989]WOE73832.1 L,D-transpeptidase family protein [Parasphingorhabdus sp. SCSIO 66989]
MGCMLASGLVLPVLAILGPSDAAELPEQPTQQNAEEFELFVDPAVFDDAGEPIINGADKGEDARHSLAPVSDMDGAGQATAAAATAEISRDNGVVADSSPSTEIARPNSENIAMVGAYPIRHMLEVKGPFEHGDWVWDESAAPKKGELLITVNLEDQVLSVFRDGYEIGTAVILYGADEKPTPTGKFKITQKDIDHVSNLYFAPMPYMLRLTNDGIAIHGSQVEFGYATHGCIGVPDEFAAQLFKIAKLGDRVVINT